MDQHPPADGQPAHLHYPDWRAGLHFQLDHGALEHRTHRPVDGHALTDDTEVTFDNPSGETLPAKGTYEVTERYITLNMTSDGNLTKESGARGKATWTASKLSRY